MTDVYELLKSGGSWLGAARSYLKCNVLGGDTCTWRSDDVLEMAVRQIEELAAHAVAADGGYEARFRKMLDKGISLEIKLGCAEEINKHLRAEIARLRRELEEAVVSTVPVIAIEATASVKTPCKHCDGRGWEEGERSEPGSIMMLTCRDFGGTGSAKGH